MNSKHTKTKIERILNYKNNEYRKKYYILSNICEFNIKDNEKLYEEFQCLVKSLTISNGKFPTEDYLYEFAGKICNKSSIKDLKEFVSLKYKNINIEYDDVLNEEINKISFNSNKLDKKLEKTILEAALKSINIFESYSKGDLISLDQVFKVAFKDEEPSEKEMSAISGEESEKDFNFDSENTIGIQKVEKVKNRMIDIFSPESEKLSNNKIAKMLGFQGNGKYRQGQVGPVLSAWDTLELNMMKKMSPTGRSRGLSTLAQRKWWIFESIKLCLMLEKQANYFLGLSDNEKAKFQVSNDERIEVGKVIADLRPTGKTLSDSDIRNITAAVQNVFQKGDYDLEDNRIKEEDLMKLLYKASSSKGESLSSLRKTLNIMYPLHDTRADFEKVPKMSDKELEYLRQQNIEFDKNLEDDESTEIDEETGEPLYADEKEIEKIKSEQEVIIKNDLIDDIIKMPSINLTTIEFNKFMSQIDKDTKRLKVLIDKTKNKINPEIFSEFATDGVGNILPDIELIPDVIPAEDLTESEKLEIQDILIRFGQKQKITIIDLDKRGEIYNELCDKAVSVDEFISFREGYGLDSSDEPMSWEDIARASYGKFKKGQASRQFGIKSWFRGMFYSLSPESKSNIYSYLAERWYDRLKILDLIDDKSFSRKPSASGDPSDDKAISAKDLEKLAMSGQYKRSPKLEIVSDTLELVSKYTSPKFVKRYFDTTRDDSLDVAVQEKLQSLSNIAYSEDEYDMLIKKLEKEDQDTAAFAFLDTMFNGNSGFRMFATGILKEYYNDIIWPEVESSLAYAVKEYFKVNYPGSNIGSSLVKGEKSDDVKPEEGKELFNKIIYLVMQRTGIPSVTNRIPKIGDSKKSQEAYFKGEADPRGDFAKAVNKFNASNYSNKLYGKTGTTYNPLNRAPFGIDDVIMLLEDMFNPNGIIGKAYSKLRILTTTTEGDIISWIGNYPEAKLDQAIVLGMAMSDFYRKNDVDPTILEVIAGIGKDTKKALDDYKKKFKGLLLGKDFADYLDYEFGYEKFDPKSKGFANPGGKNFQ